MAQLLPFEAHMLADSMLRESGDPRRALAVLDAWGLTLQDLVTLAPQQAKALVERYATNGDDRARKGEQPLLLPTL